MIFKYKKVYIGIITLFLIFIVFNRVSYAFSSDLEQFVREGKKVRVRIAQEQDQVFLIPYEDIKVNFLPEKENDNIILNKNRKYQIKVDYTEKKYWKIQVFATADKEKAESIEEDLAAKGYNVSFYEEEDWYKILIGDYFIKNIADQAAESLQKEGFEPWIREYREKTDKVIKVSNANNEPVFQSNYFLIEGKINLNNKTYKDKLEVVFSDGKINIYNTTTFNSVITGVLNEKYSNKKKDNQIQLKTDTVIIRTYILNEILHNNKGYLEFDSYKGLRGISDEIEKAVIETRGNILGEEKEGYIYIEKSLSEINNFLRLMEENKIGFDQDTYKEVFNNYFEKSKLINLNTVLMEKEKVQARVEWGLDYKEVRQLTWEGPRLITILDLNLNQKNIFLEPFVTKDKIKGFGYLDNVVREEKALAAINGGFFNSTGRPLGLRMIKGEVITDSIYNRAGVIITKNGEVHIDNIKWEGYINNVIKLNKINEKPQVSEIALINRYYGDEIYTNENIVKVLIVKDGIIDNIYNNIKGESRKINIPDSGYIILVGKERIKSFNNFSDGLSVNISHQFNTRLDNDEISSIIQAGPGLITGGEVNITGEEENFQSDIVQGRAPRSALGITEDNHLILVTVDGRQSNLSVGMTLEEMAEFLYKLGVKEAVNLDGGFSAQMVVRGLTMNNPLQKRVITDGILIKSIK
ncbi:MAG: phosphodiester glycosidase family protein [Halanaerobiaceae bacterium]